MSVATTVPSLSAPVAIAALIQARPIPAVHVETNRDILDWVHVIDHEAQAGWCAKRRRRGTARHERACRQNGCRRAQSQKETTHVQYSLNESDAGGSALSSQRVKEEWVQLLQELSWDTHRCWRVRLKI
jgi:hypothetical protein